MKFGYFLCLTTSWIGLYLLERTHGRRFNLIAAKNWDRASTGLIGDGGEEVSLHAYAHGARLTPCSWNSVRAQGSHERRYAVR